MSIRLKVNSTEFAKLKNLTEVELDKIKDDAYAFFVRSTPIRSGNARRNTDLIKNKIIGNYPYAQRLDEGYSKQAPDGMIAPTVEHIETVLIPRAVRRINSGK